MQEQTTNTVVIQQRNKQNQVIRRYSKGKFLGKGGFAKVYQFTNLQNKKTYAAKIIQKNSLLKTKAKQKLHSQIKIHQSIRHAHIVGFQHFFQDNDNYYLILELCSNQTMNELVRRRKRLSIIQIQYYLLQLLNSIKFLFENLIIHRDLKLGNLFLTDKLEIKLGDFGLATKVAYEGQRKRTVCGTPNYIAPQIVDKSKCNQIDNHNGHSYQVDIWSFGVIAYTMAVGKPPFQTNNINSTYKRIQNCQYSIPDSLSIPSSLINLISKIFVVDPSRRIQINEIFNHQFFTLNQIPNSLPISTLACPPSNNFIRQYRIDENMFQKNKLYEQKKKHLLESGFPNQFLKNYQKKQIVTSDRNTFNSLKNNNNYLNRCNTRGATIQKYQTRVLSSRHSVQNIKGASYVQLQRVATVTNVIKKVQMPIQEQKKYNYFQVWIKKWVDYSSKFGVGYALNNGQFGAFFNDQSKIITNNDASIVVYFERKNSQKQYSKQIYKINNVPQRLIKKVKLIKHFKFQLEQKLKEDNEENITNYNQLGSVFVKKWMKTKHATIFRLSSRIVQLIFHDNTQILLGSQAKSVLYKNHKSQRITCTATAALESTNQQLKKRMKYARDALTKLVQNRRQDENKKPQQEKKEDQKRSFSKSTQILNMGRMSLQKFRKDQDVVLTKSSSTIGKINKMNMIGALPNNLQFRNQRFS